MAPILFLIVSLGIHNDIHQKCRRGYCRGYPTKDARDTFRRPFHLPKFSQGVNCTILASEVGEGGTSARFQARSFGNRRRKRRFNIFCDLLFSIRRGISKFYLKASQKMPRWIFGTFSKDLSWNLGIPLFANDPPSNNKSDILGLMRLFML